MLALIWFQTNFGKLVKSHFYILPKSRKENWTHTKQIERKAQKRKEKLAKFRL